LGGEVRTAVKAVNTVNDVRKVQKVASGAGKTTYQTYTKTNPNTGEVYTGRILVVRELL